MQHRTTHHLNNFLGHVTYRIHILIIIIITIIIIILILILLTIILQLSQGRVPIQTANKQ